VLCFEAFYLGFSFPTLKLDQCGYHGMMVADGWLSHQAWTLEPPNTQFIAFNRSLYKQKRRF